MLSLIHISADDVWNIKEAGEMTDEYIEENEDSIAFDPVEWITNLETRRKSYGVSQDVYKRQHFMLSGTTVRGSRHRISIIP